MPDAKTPVLELADGLRLGAGELARVRTDAPYADLATGLAEPELGGARFLGADWREMEPRELWRARGRVGRTHREPPWISNLDVGENVILRERHHGRRPDGELVAEARRLALRFGLAGLPTTRPHLLGADELVRADLVRAFLGEPALLVLDRPPAALEPELSAAVDEARARGAAVLWIDAEEAD